MRGSVTYNGHSLRDFLVQRTAAYVEQEEQHMGELTVRETLEFASRCLGAGTKRGERGLHITAYCVVLLLHCRRAAWSSCTG